MLVYEAAHDSTRRAPRKSRGGSILEPEARLLPVLHSSLCEVRTISMFMPPPADARDRDRAATQATTLMRADSRAQATASRGAVGQPAV